MLMNGKNATRAMGLKNATVATAAKTSPMAAPAAAPAPVKITPDYTDQVGDNVQFAVSGDVLTITIDLKKDFGLSSSGKTRTVASTRGWADIATHRGVRVGLNVIRK